MKIHELIKSENTDEMYERWAAYREELTGHIIASFADMGMEDKPTLAIWGAGGCIDINLKELVKYFKLVLIDCDKYKVIKAMNRYGLKEYEAVAADLYFYDIPIERYEDYEELLGNGAEPKYVHSFMAEVLHEAVSTDMGLLPTFDYSVAVGLASQLNARAAALLYLYQENYSKEILDEFIEHIHIMDREGVRRLWEIVNKTTKKKILWGYEAKILETNRDLNIEANDILKKNIAEALEKGVYVREESVKGMKWPFMEGKSYEMDVEIVGVRK